MMTQVPLIQNINLRPVTLFLTNKSILKTKSNIPELYAQQYYVYGFSYVYLFIVLLSIQFCDIALRF